MTASWKERRVSAWGSMRTGSGKVSFIGLSKNTEICTDLITDSMEEKNIGRTT